MPQPSNDQQRLYKDLAWTWPVFSPPQHYIDESLQIAREIRKHSQIEAKTLLHLGCGGGHNDYTLKKHFAVTGVDLSQAMLSLARQLNPEVTYLLGNMRSVQLDKNFDAVICLDSIDYMLTGDDLRAVFTTAFNYLKPGGVFITTVEETPDRFQQNKTNSVTRVKGDTEITFIENYYDPDPSDTTYQSTFIYLIRRQGKLQIETDRHLCGIFPLETWFRLLNEAGLILVSQKEHQIPHEDDETRLIWVCDLACIKPP